MIDDQLNADLRRKIMGYLVSQAIFAVVELGVPDRLAAGPEPVDVLAADLGADADALTRFLRVLVAEGVFTEPARGVFGLAPLGTLLLTATAGSLRHFAELMAGEAYAAWGAAAYSVRTGKPAFDTVHGRPYFSWLADNKDAADRFNRAQAGLVELRLLPLLEWDWRPVRTVVDIGGGNGALLATLLARHPHLTGTVFDLPHVVAAAGQVLAAAGVQDRGRPHGGDFFASVPAGADVYVLSQILHDWADEPAAAILRRCRQAVPPHGRLLVVEQLLPDTDEPHPARLLDLHMLVLLGGRERTHADWQNLLSDSGFAIHHVYPGPRSAVIEAVPVRSDDFLQLLE